LNRADAGKRPLSVVIERKILRAAPGAAAVESGPDGAYLRIAADRRDLAAAVDWVRLEGAQ